MKKGLTIIDFIIIFIIISIIGIISILLVVSVVKNIKKDGNQILIDNYANDILFAKELYMKNNNNNIPKYCNINDDIIYYDENYNNKYDSNELLCNKECDNDNCIKYFVTYKDIDNKNIKCEKIILNENSIEVSNCFIDNKEINDYKYILNLENSVE